MRQIFLIIFIALFSILINGCGSPTPLQKLQSDNKYDDMNTSFWSKEKNQNSELWKQAVVYCNQHNEKPNCAVVVELQIVSHGATDVPAYGSSGHYLTVPGSN